MPSIVRVALYGFSDFEHAALSSFFRLAGQQRYRYVLVQALDDADFIVADGAPAARVAAIEAAARSVDTFFVGGHAPARCAGRLARPIDTLQLLRELDARVALRSIPVTSAAPEVDALIVDDSAVAQAYLQHRLAEFGIGAALAADSAQALHWLSRRAFGHVFIDLELGDGSTLDGLGLCRRIKQAQRRAGEPAPVIVMVSAHHGELDRVRGAFAGCDHYLAKPVHRDALRKVLKRSTRAIAPRAG